MKNLFIILTVFLATIFASEIYAQDIIVLKTGEEILSEVVKIEVNEIEYKKYENLDGPIYTLLKSEVFMIKYENGTKDIFNKIEEPKPTSPATKQIVFPEEEIKKVDNFDVIVGMNLGVGFLSGNDIEKIYGGGETHFKLFIGSRIKKTNLLLFYEKTNSNGHPIDEDGNQYEEITSKLNLNKVGIQASFGNTFYFGPRLASVTITESFEFESMEISGESSGFLIGLNLGFVTKGKFQFFGEINLDYLDFNEEDVDEGALAKDDASFTNGSINVGIRLKF